MSLKKSFLFFILISFSQLIEVNGTNLFNKTDYQLANLLDEYKKQESNRYDEFNECLKIWNKADYFDYYQYGKPYADVEGPKFYIRQLPTGEEILSQVDPDYPRNFAPTLNKKKTVKFWQRCHVPIRQVPYLMEVVIGEIYPTYNEYTGEEDGGAFQWIWKDKSKKEILFLNKDTDGQISKQIEIKKCPIIVDSSKMETSDEARVLGYAQKFENIISKYGHACISVPLIQGDIN